MKAVKEREWRTRFIELPLLLKIVVVWVYFISIVNFLRFFITLIMRLSLDPFALVFGYLIWVLADGLMDRSNLARIIALVCFGFSAAFPIYVVWNGGKVSLDGLNLTVSFPGSIIWIVASCSSILILSIPQIGRLFSNSTQEGKQ